ncbi:hypothetical protein GA0070606_3077 [Micromonospora citrea]|uniref:Uncharacterized protein n=1 Tax=Micromonospora citrea TaxID=47855 RepID=A0A1C6UYX6_9ACTN|nr:hypothetical protein GA0070606_3077 [Micromonospora citrea]
MRPAAGAWARTGSVVPAALFYGILPTVDSAVRRTQGQQRPATADSGK